MTNEMVLKNSQKKLVMPQHYIELESEEMSYIEGGFFLGIEVSAAFAVSFYNLCSNAAMKYACGVPGILSIIKTIPQLNAMLDNLTSLLLKVLKKVPLWGRILAGVVIGSLAAATVYCGSKGHGFKFGLEIGWFNVEGVCEFT